VEFRASSYRSGFIGLAIVGGLAAGVIGLVAVLVSTGGASLNRPPSPRAFILGIALVLDLVLLILTLYWSIAALRLSYSLSRNGLMIRWGASRLLVPAECIQAVVMGSEMGAARDGLAGLRAQAA
jgi:hypothetical protein